MTRRESSELAAAVRELLAEVGAQGDLTTITDTDSLLASGVLDSMAMVGVVSGLETRFGITVDEHELSPEHFDSVTAIAALVARKLGAP